MVALVRRVAVAGQVLGDRDVVGRVERDVRRAHAGVEQADPAVGLVEVEVRVGEDLRAGVDQVVVRVGVGGRLLDAVGELQIGHLVVGGQALDGLQRQAHVRALDQPVGVQDLAAELLELGGLLLVEIGAAGLDLADHALDLAQDLLVARALTILVEHRHRERRDRQRVAIVDDDLDGLVRVARSQQVEQRGLDLALRRQPILLDVLLLELGAAEALLAERRLAGLDDLAVLELGAVDDVGRVLLRECHGGGEAGGDESDRRGPLQASCLHVLSPFGSVERH